MIRFLLLIGMLFLAGCYPAAKVASPKVEAKEVADPNRVVERYQRWNSDLKKWIVEEAFEDGRVAKREWDEKIEGPQPKLEYSVSFHHPDHSKSFAADVTAEQFDTLKRIWDYGDGKLDYKYETSDPLQPIDAELIEIMDRCTARQMDCVLFLIQRRKQESEQARKTSSAEALESQRIFDQNVSQNWRDPRDEQARSVGDLDYALPSNVQVEPIK